MMPTRILIVDDSGAIRKLVRVCIEAQAGWSVCAEASNGQEAIELAEQQHPDAVVMDLSMPVMNGLEAGRILCKIMPSVPLIMLTFFSTPNLEQEAFHAGYKKVILKTQSLDDLVRSIHSLVAKAA
jgi:DNA-binding NarL/FixJ family response regulator